MKILESETRFRQLGFASAYLRLKRQQSLCRRSRIGGAQFGLRGTLHEILLGTGAQWTKIF